MVGLHSEYATAWNMLGRVRMMQDDREGGRTAFEKAVEADPKYLDPYPISHFCSPRSAGTMACSGRISFCG